MERIHHSTVENLRRIEILLTHYRNILRGPRLGIKEFPQAHCDI
jgi:hypothetical protein